MLTTKVNQTKNQMRKPFRQTAENQNKKKHNERRDIKSWNTKGGRPDKGHDAFGEKGRGLRTGICFFPERTFRVPPRFPNEGYRCRRHVAAGGDGGQWGRYMDDERRVSILLFRLIGWPPFFSARLSPLLESLLRRLLGWTKEKWCSRKITQPWKKTRETEETNLDEVVALRGRAGVFCHAYDKRKYIKKEV